MTESSQSAVPAHYAEDDGPPLCFGFDPASRRVTVDGELDFANGAALAGAIAGLYDRDPGRVTVDVHDLEFSDAASLTLFLASCKALHLGGMPLRIEGASPTARSACHAAGLDALLTE
jgi:anti-anti-sigma factor